MSKKYIVLSSLLVVLALAMTACTSNVGGGKVSKTIDDFGGLKINGTSFVDSSRNITAGTISGTTGTFTGKTLIGTSTISNSIADAEVYSTGTTTFSIDASGTKGSCIKMKTLAGSYVYCTVNGTTFGCSATSCE